MIGHRRGRARRADAAPTVAETGEGISADELPRIFECFWRCREAEQIFCSGIGWPWLWSSPGPTAGTRPPPASPGTELSEPHPASHLRPPEAKFPTRADAARRLQMDAIAATEWPRLRGYAGQVEAEPRTGSADRHQLRGRHPVAEEHDADRRRPAAPMPVHTRRRARPQGRAARRSAGRSLSARTRRAGRRPRWLSPWLSFRNKANVARTSLREPGPPMPSQTPP